MLRILEYVSPEKAIENDRRFDVGDILGMEFFFNCDEDFIMFNTTCVNSLKDSGKLSYGEFRSMFGYDSTAEHESIGWTDDFFSIAHCLEDGYHSITVFSNPAKLDV